MSASTQSLGSLDTHLWAIGGQTDGPTWATVPAAAPGTRAGLESWETGLRGEL